MQQRTREAFSSSFKQNIPAKKRRRNEFNMGEDDNIERSAEDIGNIQVHVSNVSLPLRDVACHRQSSGIKSNAGLIRRSMNG